VRDDYSHIVHRVKSWLSTAFFEVASSDQRFAAAVVEPILDWVFVNNNRSDTEQLARELPV
jgi:hypothetical protein